MKSNTSKVVSTKNIEKEIKSLVAEAVKDSYGVAEIASESKKKGKEEKIIVKIRSDETFVVDVHVIVASGVKITESLMECQKIVKYRLDRKFAKKCSAVNVLAEGISSK